VKEEETFYIQQNRGRLTSLVTCCVETAFCDTLLKELIGKIAGTGRRGRKVSTYWMTVRKQEDVGK
jgi:hypothetical protein